MAHGSVRAANWTRQQHSFETRFSVSLATEWPWGQIHDRASYSIDSRMKARLAVAALNNAVARRAATGADVVGRIVHADRGS